MITRSVFVCSLMAGSVSGLVWWVRRSRSGCGPPMAGGSRKPRNLLARWAQEVRANAYVGRSP